MRASNVCVVLVAASLAAGTAFAQCPDGSPPPCGATRRPVATPAASRPTPPPATVRARRFLLLPFRNVTRTPAQEWLVSGAPLMLASALGQFKDLLIVPEERLSAAMRRASVKPDAAPDADQLKTIAGETGGWTAVSGTVLASGGKVHVGVQALDIATTQVVSRLDGDIAADADVRLAFDTLAARLLQITGVSGPNTIDIAALTTTSVDAYRAYVNGVDDMRRFEVKDAIDAFTQAVKLDSAFAMAWARLGFAYANTSAGLDPHSPAYTSIEHATRLGARLPQREERLARALQATMLGRMSAAQAVLDSVIAADPGDLEAREYRAAAEYRDLLLMDTLAPRPRLRGSWNHAARMLEDVIARDPARGSAYAWLARIYGEAAGAFTMSMPFVPALKQEASSLAELLNPSAYKPVAVVMRDTIEFVSEAAYGGLTPTAQAESRQRALATARMWTDRWLASAPTSTMAHYIAAMLANAANDAPRASKELGSFDISKTELTPAAHAAMRAHILLGLGQLDAAARLADSLRTANSIPAAWYALTKPRMTADLLAGQLDAVERLADTGMVRTRAPVPRCQFITASFGDHIVWPLPVALRVAIMDSVVAHYDRFLSSPSWFPCVLPLASQLVRDSAGVRRDFAVAHAMHYVDSTAAIPGPRGDAALAVAGILLRSVDSTAMPRLRSNERYVRVANALSMLKRFEPAGFIVSGDSISASFRWIGPAPATWDFPGSNLSWTLRADVSFLDAGDTATASVFALHPYTLRSEPATGGITEAAASLTIHVVTLSKPVAGIRGPAVPADVRVEGDIVRLVARGGLADVFRRSHPVTAQFGLVPCGIVTGGLCGSPSMRIEYR